MNFSLVIGQKPLKISFVDGMIEQRMKKFFWNGGSMAAVNVEYVNPFLLASTSVIKNVCSVEVKIGTPYIRKAEFTEEEFLIMLGVTGTIKGQVIICFEKNTSLDIASKMCMMQLEQLDDLARSALCELCNMILGNAATVFFSKGISVDITPPTMCHGNVTFENRYANNICIPLIYEEGHTIEIDVAIKGD